MAEDGDTGSESIAGMEHWWGKLFAPKKWVVPIVQKGHTENANRSWEEMSEQHADQLGGFSRSFVLRCDYSELVKSCARNFELSMAPGQASACLKCQAAPESGLDQRRNWSINQFLRRTVNIKSDAHPNNATVAGSGTGCAAMVNE